MNELIDYNGKLILLDSYKQIKYIKKMFGYAKRYMIMMSPFWDDYFVDQDDFKGLVYKAASRCVNIIFICRTFPDFLRLDLCFESEKRPYVHIYIIEAFHAKIYMNETASLVTSMNTLGFENNNLGVLLLHGSSNMVEHNIIEYIQSLFINEKDKEEFLSIVLPKKTEE